MVKYTVLAYFYIDTEERYLRERDPFFSFLQVKCARLEHKYSRKIQKRSKNFFTRAY